MTMTTLHFVSGDGRGPRPAPTSEAELSPVAAQLARLVPAVYRSRNDSVPGKPLLTLLEVVAEQLALLDDAAERLLDDRFVERASPTALRLLAELVGARLRGDDVRVHRAVVGRTVHWRRRKGTLATLAEVLTFTSGWSAEVDEAFRSLLLDQDLALPQTWRGRTAVLWDPIALADPLTRRSSGARSARDAVPGPELVRRRDEDVEQTLRRVGAVDAGRHAASPRTVDLLGWARPDRVVTRTDRLSTAELDGLVLPVARVVPHRDDPTVELRGYTVDPRGRDQVLVGRFPVDQPDDLARLTPAHEPGPERPTGRFRDGVLTPTALAHDTAGVEAADTLSVFVDGVRLVGPADVAAAGDPLPFAPVGPSPTLRFADAGRPGAGEEWELRVHALEAAEDVPAAVLPDVPPAAGPSPAVLTVRARLRERDPVTVGPAALAQRGGAGVALRIARVVGSEAGARRAPDGTWTTTTTGPRQHPVLTGVVAVDLAGTTTIVRVERTPAGCAVASWIPDDPAARWTATDLDLTGLSDDDLPDLDPPASGPALALAARGEDVLLVGPVRNDAGDTPGLGLWRIGDLGGAPTVERLDAASARRPGDRVAPSVVVDGDRLVLHGGQRAGRVLGDTWSVGLAGTGAGEWRGHVVRDRVHRVDGVLVPTANGIVLVGGASQPGELAAAVYRVDLTRARPAWERLDDLPVPAGAPGVVLARADATASGAGVEAVAWIDSVRPVRLRTDGARGWVAGPTEPDGPNPPADGDALFLGDELVVTGPSPLPPAEVVLSVGGTGHLAFLPTVDPARGEALVFTVADDGSTRRWLAPGDTAADDLRLGAGRAAPTAHRDAPGTRVGVPGRLAWSPLRIRQVSLGPWDQPVALTLPDAVGVDPRLGRLLIRAEIADGPLTATVRLGRPAPVGAGFAPPAGRLPEAWRDPADPGGLDVEVPDPVAWVSPDRAGLDSPAATPVRHAIGPTLADVLDGDPGDPGETGDPAPPAAVGVGILGSPRLAPEVLVAGQRNLVSVTADVRARPFVAEDDGISLALHERVATLGGEDPDEGPHWHLRGLATAGRVELAASAGRLDLHWCTVAVPGAVGVRVAGAGHAPGLVRHSLPRPRVAVRLVGCEVGVLEVPPWAEVTAVGCTFDAGAPDAVAVSAAGAQVQLRHCTIHGRTLAGTLRATSSVFRGSIVSDRPDQGWLRYCVETGTGRPPLRYRGATALVSFASLRPTDPDYLRLDDNNPGLLDLAERDLTPGAHHELAGRRRELELRTDEFLPLALVPFHVDRAAVDLVRTRRLR